jgi:hypothetical protein
MSTKARPKMGATRKSLTAATPPETPPEPAPTEPVDAPTDPMPTSGMVCLLLADDTATALQTAFPPPEGATIPAPPHITLNFLGDVSALDRPTVEAAINAALSGADTEEDTEEGAEGSPGDTDTVTGVFGGWGRFAAESDDNGNEGGNLTPIVALFDSPDLDEIQAALEDALEAAGMPEPTHGFTAHSTLCRVALSDTDTIAFPAPPMLEATFSEVALVWGDYTDPANIMMFPIAGTEAPAPEAEPAVPAPAPAMGLATDAPIPGAPETVPLDAVPDEERTIPVPGPLGMFEACLVTEGTPTDEVFPDEDGGWTVMGRLIPPGVLTWRTPPLPGGFAMDEMGNPADMGHANAPIACNALAITREGNRLMAQGPYADNPAAGFLKAAIDNGSAIAPSIDLGASDVWDITTDADGKTSRTLLSGSINGFVVLPYEAQHSTEDGEWLTWFRSAPDTALTPPEAMPDEMPALVPVAASAVVACGQGTFGAPLYPPREWFETPAPNSGEIVGPTYTDEGQVFGHASGGTCHIGIPGTCLRVNDDMLDRDFRVFHKGLDGQHRGIKTAEGDLVQVGQVTLAGGHADTALGAAAARKHYDDTDSVIANVRITWDEKAGAPWMAGAIQHTATEGQVQQMRAAGEVSVDYRQLEDGRLHLIALPVVPRGGFPPLRALSAGGELKTLILTAAGEMAVIGAADLPIAPRDTTWDASGASKRLASLCTEGDTLDPGCFGRGFFWRDDSQPDTNVGSYSLPFADVINGQLQAVYAGVSAGAGRLGQADIPAADKDRIKGKMAAYYARFAEAFNDPTIKPPWEDSKSAVAADGLLLALAKDLYARQLGEVASVLASAHERERERLGTLVR